MQRMIAARYGLSRFLTQLYGAFTAVASMAPETSAHGNPPFKEKL
jgi:hypothetical protein